MIPYEVVEIRRELCAECAVEDPCARCIHGKWGQYEQTGCPQPVVPVHPTPDGSQSRGYTSSKPGDLLAAVIFNITGQQAGSCACATRQAQMNEWSWLGCWRHRKQIIGWLCEEAAKRGHAIDASAMWPLFKAAWSEARTARAAKG